MNVEDLSAPLARHAGAAQIFDGPDGFIALFQRGEYRRELVLDGLGEHLQSSRISTKPFPCGRPTHALLEAALELRAELGDAGIEEVVVYAPPALAVRPARRSRPPSRRPTASRTPSRSRSRPAARRSPRSSSPSRRRQSVRAMYARIRIVEDESGSTHGVIEVRDRGGRTLRRVASEASGGPSNPLSERARLAKLWSLYEYSGRPFGPGALREAISLVERADRALLDEQAHPAPRGRVVGPRSHHSRVRRRGVPGEDDRGYVRARPGCDVRVPPGTWPADG